MRLSRPRLIDTDIDVLMSSFCRIAMRRRTYYNRPYASTYQTNFTDSLRGPGRPIAHTCSSSHELDISYSARIGLL
jgi:hypothetical protein